MELEKKIEAILFFKGEPIAIKKLMDILKVSKEDMIEAIVNLHHQLKDRGIVLMENEEQLTLGTNAEFSELIQNLQKEELNKELSKSSLETLSIILYKNGATRADIDYIRGVNSSFTLRLLSVRGLINKYIDAKDSRRYIYKPSFDLLSYLGVKSVIELPEYAEVNKNIEKSIEEFQEIEKTEENKDEFTENI